MVDELRELWRFRELLLSLVERELRIRYKNSVLGFFWSLLNPLLTALVMTLVFKYFLGQSVGSYVLYVLAAYLPYIFVQFALMDSAQSVLTSLPIVRKVYFPREVLPMAQVIANFIHFCLAMVVFFLIAVAVWVKSMFGTAPVHFPIQPTVVLLPVLMVINLMAAMGIGFIVSALNTFYEDVKYMLGAILYVGFFLCPVMYFSENVLAFAQRHGALGQAVYTVYHLNPMATLCTAYKKVLLATVPIPARDPDDPSKMITIPGMALDWRFVAIAGVSSFLILVIGYSVFNRVKWKFVERP
jgi:lipopolysaccharide transport system permease protein